MTENQTHFDSIGGVCNEKDNSNFYVVVKPKELRGGQRREFERGADTSQKTGKSCKAVRAGKH